MSASVMPLLVRAEEAQRELPMPPAAYGALAFLAFLILLGVTWSFRNTANKVPDRHGTRPGAMPGDHH
jgi:hypothetical protein